MERGLNASDPLVCPMWNIAGLRLCVYDFACAQTRCAEKRALVLKAKSTGSSASFTRVVSRIAGALAAAFIFTSTAQAASISYYLDQSNSESTWPDGVNYLQVTIFDSILHPGDIEFLVTPLSTLTSTAGPNFGIQKFGFNTTGAASGLVAANIIQPVGWMASQNVAFDGFGEYEVSEDTTGQYRQNPLSFRITGIAGDTPYDYVVAGQGGTQGVYFFAAHVAGMTVGPGSAYFGGSTEVTEIVPVPAAAWLLMSALGCLGIVRRRLH